MTEQAERNRLLYGVAGAALIHLVVFALIQFIPGPAAVTQAAPAPIYVQLSATTEASVAPRATPPPVPAAKKAPTTQASTPRAAPSEGNGGL